MFALARILLVAGLVAVSLVAGAQSLPDGSKDRPLRVMLVPADGGTDSGTKADFQPVFNAVSRMTNLNFDIKVGQTYGAVVEAMCNGLIDIAFYGPVSYVQANKRGCAQLLAVAVEKGESVYYAGMFTKAGSGIKGIEDVKGKRVAFGDVNSASSFTFQMAMLLDARIDPTRDLREVRMTGSHANSIAALSQGLVDVANASFDSYEKAVRQGAIDPKQVTVIAKSIAIPYPPLAMNTKLPEALKTQMKTAFNEVHKAPGVTPEMIRGYGGKKVDAYNANYPESEFNIAAQKLAMVTDEIKAEMLKKASAR
jgi:phosphonate transport system substrate-binding protein